MKLAPTEENVKIRGKLWYDYNTRANTIIRVKKELYTKFPQLKKRELKVFYEMILFPSYQELLKCIKLMEQNYEPVPLILFFEENQI